MENLFNISMISKEELQAFPTYRGWETLVADAILIEPAEIGTEEGVQQDWRSLNVYVIQDKPFQGWQLGQSDSIELEGRILSDIKANGLICYWNPVGKMQVRKSNTLRIWAINDTPDFLITLNQVEKN